MGITGGCAFVQLLCLMLLYKNLTPISSSATNIGLNATSKLAEEQESEHLSGEITHQYKPFDIAVD